MRLVILILMLGMFWSTAFADEDIPGILPPVQLLTVPVEDLVHVPEPKKVEVEEPDVSVKATAYMVMLKYGISMAIAYEVSKYAHLLSSRYSGFPRAKDILVIAWIESSMNPTAKSRWAEGLMGINYKANDLDDSKKERHDISLNMSHGVEILRSYYLDLKSRELALMAYNYGITSVKNGRRNYTYVRKYKRELNTLGEIK